MELIPELEKGNPRRNIWVVLTVCTVPRRTKEWVDKVGMPGGCREGKGSIQFSNGIKYTGDFIGGHLQGTGEVEYKNGHRYRALFKHSGLIKYLGEAEKKQDDIVRFLQKESNEEEKQRKIEQAQLEKEAAEYRAMQQQKKDALGKGNYES